MGTPSAHSDSSELSFMTTGRWKDGRLLLAHAHYERMAAFWSYLDSAPFPFSFDAFLASLHALGQRFPDGRMQWYVDPMAQNASHVDCRLGPLPPRFEARYLGMTLHRSERIRNSRNNAIKWSDGSWREGLYTATEGLEEEVILISPTGHLTEGSYTNIVLSVKGEWITPEMDPQAGVWGLAIQDLVRFCKRGGHDLACLPCKMDMLEQAEGIWLTNALMGYAPVTSLAFAPSWVPTREAPDWLKTWGQDWR